MHSANFHVDMIKVKILTQHFTGDPYRQVRSQSAPRPKLQESQMFLNQDWGIEAQLFTNHIKEIYTTLAKYRKVLRTCSFPTANYKTLVTKNLNIKLSFLAELPVDYEYTNALHIWSLPARSQGP